MYVGISNGTAPWSSFFCSSFFEAQKRNISVWNSRAWNIYFFILKFEAWCHLFFVLFFSTWSVFPEKGGMNQIKYEEFIFKNIIPRENKTMGSWEKGRGWRGIHWSNNVVSNVSIGERRGVTAGIETLEINAYTLIKRHVEAKKI